MVKFEHFIVSHSASGVRHPENTSHSTILAQLILILQAKVFVGISACYAE
jgi:hypothetical protein